MIPLPPIQALFLTHFDDTKGQTVIYYKSTGIPQGDIEHASLPSGLHSLESDVVTFMQSHGDGNIESPAVGLFRSRKVSEGRGKRMGTLGIVLARDEPQTLFTVQKELGELYDQLEESSDNPFRSDQTPAILDGMWDQAVKDGTLPVSLPTRGEAVKALIDGRGHVSPDHPISYLSSLLTTLGPLIITIYKYAIAGKKILIYSQPPLLPVAAFAYCVSAMSLSPKGDLMKWIGNVGVIDLDQLMQRRQAWVANAILRSHLIYDLFIDLSTNPPTLSTPPSLSLVSNSGSIPRLSYSLSSLPLYKSLLMLDASPPVISITQSHQQAEPEDISLTPEKLSAINAARSRSIYSGPGGWWLFAFDVFNKFWNICVGVCEYAVGRGQLGIDDPRGEIYLQEGEEDARPLIGDLEDIEHDGQIKVPDESHLDDQQGEAEAVRRGRLILRQLYHNTYHLQSRLMSALSNPKTERRQGLKVKLDQRDLKELVGSKLYVSAEDRSFWMSIAERWDFILGESED